MEELIFYGVVIFYVLLAGLLQFFISRSAWSKLTKILTSIGVFLFMLVTHIAILTVVFYETFTTGMEGDGATAIGFLLGFLFAWVVGLTFCAGVVQLVIALIIWFIKRGKKEIAEDSTTTDHVQGQKAENNP